MTSTKSPPPPPSQTTMTIEHYETHRSLSRASASPWPIRIIALIFVTLAIVAFAMGTARLLHWLVKIASKREVCGGRGLGGIAKAGGYKLREGLCSLFRITKPFGRPHPSKS